MDLRKNNREDSHKIDEFICLLLSLTIYLPGSGKGNIIRSVVLFAAFLVVLFRKNLIFNAEELTIPVLMILSPLFSGAFVLLCERSINTGMISHEISRMLYCSVLILTVSNLSISINTAYIASVLALVPNFLLQFMQYSGIEWAFNFIRNNYVLPEDTLVHFNLARLTGASFRSGSIFLNPNVYMIIPLISLCVFISMDAQKPSLINTILMGCSCLSCFLTGSRTAFIVMVVILSVYIFKYSSSNRKIIFAFAVILFLAIFGNSLVKNSRGLNVSELGSFTGKFEGLFKYFRTVVNPIYLLTGSIGTSVRVQIDAEIGYIYSWYGILGLYWYAKYYKAIIKNNSDLVFFSKVIAISCGLVAMTASVLLCMPIYSYVGMIAFSTIRLSKLQNYEENIN